MFAEEILYSPITALISYGWSAGRLREDISKSMESYIVVDMRQWYRAGDVDPALILLLECNVWRLLIDSYAEAFELVLDYTLVG